MCINSRFHVHCPDSSDTYMRVGVSKPPIRRMPSTTHPPQHNPRKGDKLLIPMDKELNLSELYNSIETLKKLETKGVAVPDTVYAQLAAMEEQLIRDKVLPVVSDKIEPVLREICRQLTLVVEYRPDEPITVRLSRERNLSDLPDAQPLTLDPVPDIIRRNRQQRNGKRQPVTRLRVATPDGRVFCDERDATNTFCSVLEYAGLMRVRELGIMVSGINLVSTSNDPNRYQHPMGRFYISTNRSTADKAKLLRRISDLLSLGLTIEII